MKRLVRAALLWSIVIVLIPACSSANIRRDLDVSGSLPRAIGLGSFTPACLFLCFPSATTTQGNTTREDIEDGEPFIVHSESAQEFKGKAASPKARLKRK